jgi:hypothetical protein
LPLISASSKCVISDNAAALFSITAETNKHGTEVRRAVMKQFNTVWGMLSVVLGNTLNSSCSCRNVTASISSARKGMKLTWTFKMVRKRTSKFPPSRGPYVTYWQTGNRIQRFDTNSRITKSAIWAIPVKFTSLKIKYYIL